MFGGSSTNSNNARQCHILSERSGIHNYYSKFARDSCQLDELSKSRYDYNIVSQKKNIEQDSFKKRFLEWLNQFSPLSLISSSVFGGVALASFCVMSFITYNNYELINHGDKVKDGLAFSLIHPNSEITLYRGNNQIMNKNIPSSWIIKEGIAFALDYYSGEKSLNSNDDIEVNIGDELVFNIIPFETKIVDVDYITDKGERINIYSKLSLEKGKTFTSKKLEIDDPLGLDKIMILEKGNLILEKNILVKQ